MMTTAAIVTAEGDEGKLAKAASLSDTPKLVHDGESYRIYHAVLPATGIDDNSTDKGSKQQKIRVAMKTCQPLGHGDLLSNLNNEYNILRLDQMANCPSVRTAIRRDKSFAAPTRAGEKGTKNGGSPNATAIYLEWVEGTTLFAWLGRSNDLDFSSVNTDTNDESMRLLVKVRVASSLADAVANIHEAGVVHNDLNGDNVIISFDDDNGCRATLIDFEYADQFSRLEGTDDGERINDDMPQLASLLREIFATRDGGGDGHSEDCDAGSGASRVSPPNCSEKFGQELCFGDAHGEFSGIFLNIDRGESGASENAADFLKSVYDFNGDERTSVTSADVTASFTSGGANQRPCSILGVPQRVNVDKEVEDDGLPKNLPRSVRRVLAGVQDFGHDTCESAYRDAREVAEDLRQMACDPAIFLADPKKEDCVKGVFRRPPRRLYGRENELAVLRGAEGRLMDENRGSDAGRRTEVILIAGRSGTGKSSLLRQAKSESKGVFVVGKFDQLQSMQPYSALIAAFDKVVHSILAKDAEEAASIKEDILNAVGTNGKVLTDVIPSLVKVIGEQPKVAHVTGIEAQNRFRYIAQCFTRAICTPQRPLICVLDDLQWCDPASIDLMKTLVTDESNKYLLFIGCYRADEMSEHHHVFVQFEGMKNKNVPFTTIELGSMGLDSMTSFVSEKLRLPRRLTKSISEIVHRKSMGNAFFATTFLQSLAESRLLTFSADKMRWIWNEAAVDAKNISDDVVEVMAEKIQTLQRGAQDLLMTASCIGASFEKLMMASLMAESFTNETLDEHLNKLVKQGLIIKMIRRDADESYKFSHDRIQQAAYSLVPKIEKEELHLRIGRILEKGLSDAAPACLVFKTVDQLNRGSGCIADRDEQVELAVLNARAAEEAYKACAFTPSTEYAQKSLDILGNEDTVWSDHYNLALTLNNLLAELKYCEGNFNEAMQITQCIFDRAKTFDDQFTARMCNLKSLMLSGDLDDALTSSLRILRELGEPLPKKPSLSAIMVGFIKTKQVLRKRTDEYILSLPEMTNERIIKTTKILNIVGAVTYLMGSNYLPIITFKTVRLMLKYGQSSNCGYALTSYGLLCYAVMKDIEGGCRFGKLGLSLSSKAMITQSSLIMYGCIAHWRFNVALTLDPLQRGFKEGLESGDILYAIYNVVLYNIHRLHSGQASIQAIITQQQESVQELTKIATSSASEMYCPIQQAALNLTGHSQDPTVLSGEVMDEERLISRSSESGNILLQYYVRVNAACLAYIFGDYDRASTHSLKIQDFADKFPGLYYINIQAFYDGLSSYALARTMTNSKKWRKRGQKMMKKFAKWAKDCPSNNTHKVLLLKAEDASLFAIKSKKKRDIAEQAYKSAILDAKNSGFVNVAAIASERAAEFYNIIGQHELFLSHISQAYHLYFQWGADGKCEHIAMKYPGIQLSSQHRE